MKKILSLAKSQVVMLVSLITAIITSFFVPKFPDFIGYINFDVLFILFCLMAVVQGLVNINFFKIMSNNLLTHIKSLRGLYLFLIMICFFSSMLLTNDVALITFVPFAILVLSSISQQKNIIFVVVMQTIAANLGSALTPIGNPQNLYLYSYYSLSIFDFLKITAPLTALSFVLIVITVFIKKQESICAIEVEHISIKSSNMLFVYILLFLVCILSVSGILSSIAAFLIILVFMVIFDRDALKKVDYSLLVTFIGFFVFVGNLSNIGAVSEFVTSFLEKSELLAAFILSQFISNVPASVFLSAFTDKSQDIILGVNIGGLGTLIASFASLISYRFYSKTQGAATLKYLCVFTAVCIVFAVLLLLPYIIF